MQTTPPAFELAVEPVVPSRCDRGVTPRVVVLSLALAAAFGYVIPLIDNKFANTSLGGTHLPLGSVGILLLLLWAVNPLLNLIAPRFRFSRNETLTIYITSLFSVLVPGRGAESFFIPNVLASFYAATRENQWMSFLQPYVKPWLTPALTVEGRYNEAVVQGWYMGTEGAVPWGAWLVPLAAWAVLIFTLYAMLACLGVILRAQWADHETLSFPLLRLPLDMTVEEQLTGKKAKSRQPFFQNPTMWVGFGIAAFIQLLNGLNLYYPDVPRISLQLSTHRMFSEAPMNQMGHFTFLVWPMVAGISFLISTEVSFSLWFFYLLTKAQLIMAYFMGMAPAALPEPTWTRGWTKAFIAYQQIGAYFAYFITLALIGKHHYRHVVKRALFRASSSEREKLEPLSYPAAFWGFLACLLILVVWTCAAGVRPEFALLFWFTYIVVAVVMTRVVVEGGLLLVHAGWAPLGPLTGLIGSGTGAWLAPASSVPLAFLGGALLTDPRGFLLPSFVQGFKLAHDRGIALRPLLKLIAVSILISAALAWWSIVRMGYLEGGLQLDYWWARGNGATQAAQNAREAVLGTDFSLANWLWMGIGALQVYLIMLARAHFAWLPLHPIGLIMSWPQAMYMLWFSIFIGWACKVLILRYGGYSAYRSAAPGFLGLALGDMSMMLFWLAIDLWQGTSGHQLMPSNKVY